MSTKMINTTRFSKLLRERVVNLEEKSLLITNFYGTDQEKDLTKSPNCNGFGRIRHFQRSTNPEWPQDPLPMDPACKALGMNKTDLIYAQAFQLSACNWRCWYCFVDYSLLSANSNHATWFTTDELVELLLNEPDYPKVIDLTGGQPDLAPEWIPWMMRSLQKVNLDKSTYLWSDDNLSTDYLWRYLSEEDIELMCSYPNYGRVGCFKGFDEYSFSYNTGAIGELFDQQFTLMRRLLTLGLDQYCYVTFTTPVSSNMRDKMVRFVDRLQEIDTMLPLRTVPLEIKIFSANHKRTIKIPMEILKNQYKAAIVWEEELHKRYNSKELKIDIANIPLNPHT